MSRTRCPICGAKEKETVFYRDFSGCREIAPFKRYDVCVCRQCGGAYAGNIEESHSLGSYYQELSKYDNYTLNMDLKPLQELSVDFLLPHINHKMNIMDIGCGDGGLLFCLKEKGYTKLTGVEAYERNVEFISNHLGIEAIHGFLGKEIHVAENRKFDLIMLSGVLEHILPLHEAITQSLNYLSENGFIYVVVPDAGSFGRPKTHLFQEFSFEHVNYFTIDSLKNLFSYHGMELFAQKRLPAINTNKGLVSLWRRSLAAQQIKYDDMGQAEIKAYIEQCKINVECFRGHLKNELRNEHFYIWGMGTQTAMMFQMHMFEEKNVLGIIDSNRNYQGKYAYGHLIGAPDSIAGQYPILISAMAAKEAIAKSARKMGLQNRLILLKPET